MSKKAAYAGLRRRGELNGLHGPNGRTHSRGMRIRVSFEFGAGACLWADDAEARERWCSAVEFADVALDAVIVAEGEALMAEVNRSFLVAEHGVEPRWTAVEEAAFHERAAAWTARVAAALAAEDIAVAPYGAAAANDDVPEIAGEVVACFGNEAAGAAAAERFLAGHVWREAATWAGTDFVHRASETTPEELLAALEVQPDFVCGWWQERAGGEGAMLEGDPVEHAIACVRERNATGLANFLSWQAVRRVHLADDFAALSWLPGKRHRLAPAGGTWWEWFTFFRQARAALRGDRPSARYLKAERERLLWRWTHGGSRAGWPATYGEALERSGLRREAFNRWAK